MTVSTRGPVPETPAQGRPVTLADIARAAGTSASTASRALSGNGYVSAAVRERLLAAAEKLGYVPNASARTLKQRRSRMVGVAVSDLGNQFYARLATAIEQTLREAGYQMVLVSESDSDEATAGVRAFLSVRAAGVILTPVDPEAAALLTSHGVDVVEVDRRLAKAQCDAVVLDNERGARIAVDHLTGLGHRRVGLLVADTAWTSDAGRIRGYREALEEAGIGVDPALILPIASHAPDAEERIAGLLESAAPTALFAANDMLAERAWRALRRRGLRLPVDISMVAFDDVPWMTMVEPEITVVVQPTDEMGRRAAKLLLQRLDDGVKPPVVERLPPSLIVRGSTAAPRH